MILLTILTMDTLRILGEYMLNFVKKFNKKFNLKKPIKDQTYFLTKVYL